MENMNFIIEDNVLVKCPVDYKVRVVVPEGM